MYVILGKYNGAAWEPIDEFETFQEAKTMLKEYQLAFGPDWLLKIA